MCNSELQINYFTEKQCSKMLNCDILLGKNKANHYKNRNKNEKQAWCETNKKILSMILYVLKKNDGKRKQSKRDNIVDINQSI